MNKPERWLDTRNAAPEVLALLESARAPRALDDATRARSRRRLAALSALPAAAGVLFWFQNVALGALLGAAVGGAVLLPQWNGQPKPNSEEGSPPASAKLARAKAPPVVVAVPPPSANEGQGASAALPAVPARAGRTEAQTPDLAREALLLERARQLLGTNPSAALQTLRQHEREFGAGALLVEREFLSVDALMRLGRRAEATKRANALQRLAPGHLYEQRLESLLGADR